MLMFYALALYLAAGLGTALAFAAFGVTQLMAEPAPVTFGARLMLIPGAVALWPLILVRWLRASPR